MLHWLLWNATSGVGGGGVVGEEEEEEDREL
jgi:hypothetical protein